MGGRRQLQLESAPGPSLAGAARPRGGRPEGGCPHSPELCATLPLWVPSAPTRPVCPPHPEGLSGQFTAPPSARSCPLKTTSHEVCLSPVLGPGCCAHTREGSRLLWAWSPRYPNAALGLPWPHICPKCPPEEGSPPAEGEGLGSYVGSGSLQPRSSLPLVPCPRTDHTLATPSLRAGSAPSQAGAVTPSRYPSTGPAHPAPQGPGGALGCLLHCLPSGQCPS